MLLLRACLRSGVGGGSSARIVSRKLPSPLPAKLISSASTSSASTTPAISMLTSQTALLDVRCFSSSSGGGDDDGENDKNEEDQSIFLQNEDALPAPPSYVRDSVTGKWTDKTHAELSSKDRKLLNLDDDSKGEEVMARLGERWKKASDEVASSEEDGGDDGFGTLNKEHERVARRIQEQKVALGTIGREPADAIKKEGEDVEAISGDWADKPLTSREYQALKTYAQKEHGVHPKDFTRMADEEAIPHNTLSSGSDAGLSDPKQFFDADLDLAYLNPRLNRRAFKEGGTPEDDDPFADLLPSDFNPSRKVNRKHAKPIPKRLLHHNNLSLLRRYTTPGGKIMNRVQSRLGAKDQRKIAKLVKRARHLGLIPHLGQWKFEDHGHLHERNLDSASDETNLTKETEGKRDWELELEERGLWPLQNETELIKQYYDMGRMMDHIAGPRGEGNKKRKELEDLLGGVGALVPEDETKKQEEKEG